jgi:hypothetical protein
MDNTTLITSIIIACFSIILIPICIYGCRKCALYIIDDEEINIVIAVHDRNSNNNNDDDGNILGERERRRRERNVLNKVIIKVRVNRST